MHTQAFLAELVNYGGVAGTRAQVHGQALEDTGSGRAADRFAFGRPALDSAHAKRLISWRAAEVAGMVTCHVEPARRTT